MYLHTNVISFTADVVSTVIPTQGPKVYPKRSLRSLLTEVVCFIIPVFVAGGATGCEKFCGLKKGLACLPKPPCIPPAIPIGAACMGAVWEGWPVPNWLSHGEGAVVPVAGFGAIWFRLTLGLLEVKRESRTDISGGLLGWFWFWVRAVKFGVLVVVAMPPYRPGLEGLMGIPIPPVW